MKRLKFLVIMLSIMIVPLLFGTYANAIAMDENRENCNHNIVIAVDIAPTCTRNGWTKGEYCTLCDYEIEQTEIEALGHDMGNWYVSVKATCTTDGEERSDCSRCEYFETRRIVATKHQKVLDNYIAPTCTTDGLTEGFHCLVCDEILVAQESITKLGHDIIADLAVEPTCEESGLTAGEHCSRCNYKVEQTYVAALGHEMGEWTLSTEPTCTEEGEKISECQRENCEHSETYVLNKLGHTEVVEKGIEPSCTKDGLSDGKYCSTCNTVIEAQKLIPKTEHKMSPWYVSKQPDYEQDGEKERVCQRQGCDYKEHETIPKMTISSNDNDKNPTTNKTKNNTGIIMVVALFVAVISALAGVFIWQYYKSDEYDDDYDDDEE